MVAYRYAQDMREIKGLKKVQRSTGKPADTAIVHNMHARLKEKEQTMLDAIDNHNLEPIYTPEEDLAIIFGDSRMI